MRGKLTRKSIVVGGQYLLFIEVEDQILKAKFPAEIGQAASEDVWVKCPLEYVTLFGANGTKIATELVTASPIA